MWNFFKVELRNQDAGGVTPATLTSAMSSFRQAPNDVLGSWFGVSEFTKKSRSLYKQELLALVKAHGKHVKLSWILNRSTPPQKLKTYRVHLCRTAYSHLDIEIEAPSESQAMKLAEEAGGNYSFPTENSSEYTAHGATLI
jgi:hypothetical protein